MLSLACVAVCVSALAWSAFPKSSNLLTSLTIRSWTVTGLWIWSWILKKNEIDEDIFVQQSLDSHSRHPGKDILWCPSAPPSSENSFGFGQPHINPSNARSLGWCPCCHGSKLHFKLWWEGAEGGGGCSPTGWDCFISTVISNVLVWASLSWGITTHTHARTHRSHDLWNVFDSLWSFVIMLKFNNVEPW